MYQGPGIYQLKKFYSDTCGNWDYGGRSKYAPIIAKYLAIATKVDFDRMRLAYSEHEGLGGWHVFKLNIETLD